MTTLQGMMAEMEECLLQSMAWITEYEARELKRRRIERDRMRGVAMSDALYELKREGKSPTIYEVQKKADELQSMWRYGIPLDSERHPIKYAFRWAEL